MRRSATFFVSMALMLPAGTLAQAQVDPPDSIMASTPTPDSFVYVTRPTHIDGFAVASSGKLTPVPGSPIKAGLSSLSVKRNFSSARTTT